MVVKIAFDSRAEGEPMIYVVSTNGGPLVKVTSGHSRNVVPTWSPDGKWIYFSSDRSGQMEIWKILSTGESPEQVTHHGGFASRFSPHSHYLFYTRNNKTISALWRLELNTGAEKLISPSIINREFAPVSDGVYFFSGASPQTSTLQYTNCSDTIASLQTFEKAVRFGISLSPDGHLLYYSQFDQESHNLMLIHQFWK